MIHYITRDVTQPIEGLEVRKNCYWLCEKGNPTKALFFGTSPQCNRNRKICEMVLKEAYYSDPVIRIIFIRVAYIPKSD